MKMGTAAVQSIMQDKAGKPWALDASWNALRLAGCGDRGAAFVALPQVPPRNAHRSAAGRRVHSAKLAFGNTYPRRIRKGTIEPLCERFSKRMIGVAQLKGQR